MPTILKAALVVDPGRIVLDEKSGANDGQIEDAYERFANQRDGVLNIAMTP